MQIAVVVHTIAVVSRPLLLDSFLLVPKAALALLAFLGGIFLGLVYFGEI